MQTSEPVGTPAFRQADAFTAREEGGLGMGANFGIDQKAHPEVDIATLTAQRAQAMRYEYWKQVGGDALAQYDPVLARAVYDTAILAGPNRALRILQASGADPATYAKIRQGYLDNLVAADPKKYGAVAEGWRNRTAALVSPGPERATQSAPQVATAASEQAPPEQREPLQDLQFPRQAIQPQQARPAEVALSVPAAQPLQPRSRQQVYEAILGRTPAA